MIRLIAGLGNPGPEYADTRHNAGFWFVDEAARLLKTSLQMERGHFGLVARANVAGQSVWLGWPEDAAVIVAVDGAEEKGADQPG